MSTLKKLTEEKMIYHDCIDACFACVKACDRFAFEGAQGKEMGICVVAADVAALVARLTARNLCCQELYEVCAKICMECAKHCEKMDHEFAKACIEACKKCAEACHKCHEGCDKKCVLS